MKHQQVRSAWALRGLLGLLGLLLGLAALAYLQPAVMIDISNLLWSCVG